MLPQVTLPLDSYRLAQPVLVATVLGWGAEILSCGGQLVPRSAFGAFCSFSLFSFLWFVFRHLCFLFVSCPTLPLRVPIRVFQMGVIAPRVFVVASLYNRICYRK
jgi:hypothetical protein